ncbi:MAG: class I SAM-dependent methyltransferase [Candidatus Ancaeobacter aquaticus]|nr:class I SAM-dependent methyltransferase [Candidatus Ancaeobacter aquaticus]
MKSFLAKICSWCPWCIFERACPHLFRSTFFKKLKKICPFCRAYERERKQRVEENHAVYEKRMKCYKEQGLAVEKVNEFIIHCAGNFSEPILDVGTGRGYFAVALARTGVNLTTIDISKEQQLTAKLNADYFTVLNNIRFLIRKAHYSGFKKNSFNTIFCVNAVHHFGKPYMVIDELVSLLKVNGKMILADMDENGLRIIDRIHATEGKKHKKAGVTINDIEKYLTDMPGIILSRNEEHNEIVLTIEKK